MKDNQPPGFVWKLRQSLVLLEAITMLAAARFLIACIPLRFWRKSLGAVMAQPAGSDNLPVADGATVLRARGISRKVRRAASRVPFDAVCLPQAMAARWMLSRRGIGTRLYLGAKRSDDGRGFAFHAWLMLGDECLTGETERAAFNAFDTGKKAAM